MLNGIPRTAETLQPNRDLLQAARALVNATTERRYKSRDSMIMACTVIPIDELNQQIDEPFTAVTTNISQEGIGLLYTEPVEQERISVTVVNSSDIHSEFKCDIVRCDLIGDYYNIGAMFVKK